MGKGCRNAKFQCEPGMERIASPWLKWWGASLRARRVKFANHEAARSERPSYLRHARRSLPYTGRTV